MNAYFDYFSAGTLAYEALGSPPFFSQVNCLHFNEEVLLSIKGRLL